MRDYYQILDLPKNASQKEIRQSYRKKARLYHPDKYQNPQNKEWAENKFKDLQIAYQTLSDENKRRAYDKYGEDYLNVSTTDAETTVFETGVFYFQGPHEKFFDVGYSRETGKWWGPFFAASSSSRFDIR